MVGDAMPAAGLAPCGDLAADRVRICVGQLTRAHDDAQQWFGILEPYFRRTTELDFRRVHEVKDDNLVAAMPQIAQCCECELAIEKQVREQHYHAAAGEQGSQTLQRSVCRGPLAVRRVEQAAYDASPLTRLHARGDHLTHLLIERHESGGIALPQENQCQRCS